MDQLRDQLQQKFRSTQAAEDGWNVPSEQVWSALSGNAPTSRADEFKFRRAWIIPALALVFLGVFLLRECTHHQAIGELESRLEITRDSLDQLRQECIEKPEIQEQNEQSRIQESQLSIAIPTNNNSTKSSRLQEAKPINFYTRQLRTLQGISFTQPLTSKEQIEAIPIPETQQLITFKSYQNRLLSFQPGRYQTYIDCCNKFQPTQNNCSS